MAFAVGLAFVSSPAFAARQLSDLVCETTTTAGTGTITLGGAYGQFRSFATGVTSGSTVSFNITSGANPAQYETDTGTFTSPSTLTRTLVTSSTGSLLSLSGTSVVCLGFISSWQQPNLGTADQPTFNGVISPYTLSPIHSIAGGL